MGVRKSVLIFGGGIGGLSAAHELTEPGRASHFTVEVVEADTVLGGKARSSPVDGDPAHPNRYPGEHGSASFRRSIGTSLTRWSDPSAFPTLGRATVKDHLVVHADAHACPLSQETDHHADGTKPDPAVPEIGEFSLMRSAQIRASPTKTCVISP